MQLEKVPSILLHGEGIYMIGRLKFDSFSGWFAICGNQRLQNKLKEKCFWIMTYTSYKCENLTRAMRVRLVRLEGRCWHIVLSSAMAIN